MHPVVLRETTSASLMQIF